MQNEKRQPQSGTSVVETIACKSDRTQKRPNGKGNTELRDSKDSAECKVSVRTVVT